MSQKNVMKVKHTGNAVADALRGAKLAVLADLMKVLPLRKSANKRRGRAP